MENFTMSYKQKNPQKSYFKLVFITIMLFLSAIVYTYGKDNLPVKSDVININSYLDSFKPVAYPDLNPAAVIAATNIRLHTA